MALLITGTAVVNDSSKGLFQTVNPGTYKTRPSGPTIGDIIYYPVTNTLEYWNGSAWIPTN